jgi:hypothetical protein
VQDARQDVQDAKQDLNAAKKDAINQELATAEEWATFKRESDVKIRDNDVRFTELNV